MTLTQRVLESRMLAALASPHGVDHYLARINPMWAATEVRARIVEVVRETTGEHPVATLTLQPTGTWRGHRSGQYVQVGVAVDGARRATRCFSISSAASLPGERFTITVRAHAEGLVSKHLVNDARPGEIVHLSQAEGDFTMHESAATPTNNHLLMISGGSGITPVMSHIRTLLRDGYDGHAHRKEVTFLHYARSREDQIFARELSEIAAADNGVTVHLRYGPHLFDAAELRRMVGDFTDLDTWACGPAGLIERVQEAYGDSPRLRVEFFKPPAFATDDAEGTVLFARSGLSAENSGASLLEQAEAAGLTPEYGCRMGICFSCTSRKTEGTVRNVLTGETSSLPDEDVRICVSAPVGPCSIDL